jgi:putative membrane protein
MHGWYPGMGWGAMICGGVLGLLVLAALVVLVVLLLTRTSAERREVSSRPASPTPMDILKGRYARGEITREEYQEMRELLRE